jgi:hypothetical protein
MPGTLVTFPSLGTMLPDGQEFRHRLIRNHRTSYLQLCGAVYAAGNATDARLMLHAYCMVSWHGVDTPFEGLEVLVAGLPRGLFEGIAYAERRHGFTKATNLAAARYAISSGLLSDPDPRVRLEMLEMIHATVLSTNKTLAFFQHVLPAVLALRDSEPVASVAEHLDVVVDAFVISALVSAEVRQERTAAAVEPIIRQQITRGINVPLNRSRLIEVLIQQDRESEADAEIASFKADFGADYPLPGLYVNRPVYQTVDDAVAAMRERARDLR